MIKNIITAGVTALVVSLIVVALVGGNTNPKLGGTTNFDSLELSETLSVGGAMTVSGDATVSGRTLNVATSNTSTSTLIVGCIQTYATSTATAWRSYASSTASIEGVDGVLMLEYGTCPNL